MSDLAKRINEILWFGRNAQKKEKQDQTIKMLSELSKDYSNQEYPRMTPEQFVNSNATQAAMTPRDVIEPYYGAAFPRQVITAGYYNLKNPVLKPESYAKIFDTMRTIKDMNSGSGYGETTEKTPVAVISSGRGFQIGQENENTYRKWLNSSKPELRERALRHFQVNSLDPSIPGSTQKSILEHEVSHHVTEPETSYSLDSLRESGGKLPISSETQRQGKKASNKFEDFGRHTGLPAETTQALARFQREWFKEKGTRITNPDDFVKLVDSGEIPDFLSQEGRRILIYARNLKNVRDTSKDEEQRKAAAETIKGLSQMAPALVQNKKKIGLNLRLG